MSVERPSRNARGTAQISRGDHDVGHGLGQVGSGPQRDSDVGRGQGGCIVQSVADHRHPPALALRLERLDRGRLGVGQDAGLDLLGSQAQLGADGPGGLRVVAGQQDHVCALPAQLFDDLSGVRLERVGQGNGPDGLAVDRDPQNGAHLVLPRQSGGLDRTLIDTAACQERLRTDQDRLAIDTGLDALTADGLEVANLTIGSEGCQGASQGVLAACLGGRGEAQQSVAIPARQGQRLDDGWLAFGESPRLVEDDGGQPIHPFEGRGLAYE